LGISVKIGGVDKTEYVDARTLSIRDELTSKVNSASFDFICNDVAVAPIPGEEVLIEEGTKKLFSGRILSKEESFLPPNLLKYPVECIDHTRDLDKRLVAEHYVNQKAGDIIKDIITKYTAIESWMSPIGHWDEHDKWESETNAYDDDDSTYASTLIPPNLWGSYLHLFISGITCTKVRFKAGIPSGISAIFLHVRYEKVWHWIYAGSFKDWPAWNEISLNGFYPVTVAAVTFQNSSDEEAIAHFHEFDFGVAIPDFTTNNVADGPIISDISFDYIQVSDAITKIAEICGYEWYVDYDKDIHFFAKNTYPAPFQLDDNQADYKDLIINTNISQIRNRIFVKSSNIKDFMGEAFVADGVSSEWNCMFKAENLPLTFLTSNFPLGATATKIQFSHNDVYLAVGYTKYHCLKVWKREGDEFTALSFFSVTPDTDVFAVAWSSDDIYLAAAYNAGSKIRVWKRDNDQFTALPAFADLPAGIANDVQFSPDDTYLAAVNDGTPYIIIYKRAGDIFTKLSNPADLPAGNGNGVGWSPDGVYLAVAHDVSPFVTIYKRDGDTFTKLGNPANLPTGNGNSISWSPNGIYLAVAHAVTPFITIYKRDGDTFTKMADPDYLPTGDANDVDFSADGMQLAVGHNTTPFLTVYKHTVDLFIKQDDPEDLPAARVIGVDFSSSGIYLAVGYETFQYLTVYIQHLPTITVDGVIKTIGWDGVDNPLYYDFMLNGTTKALSLGTNTSTPANGVELLVGYYSIGVPICLKRDDQDSIDSVKAIEGGDGIFEFCITDNNIDNIAWASEVAKADLLQNANPVVNATFITNRSDIKSGQIITLNSTKRNINQQFIVQKIELIRVDVIEYYGTAEVPYKPAAEAVIGYKPAAEAEVPYKLADSGGEIIYYVFNVTIANKFRKLEDLFLYLLSRSEES